MEDIDQSKRQLNKNSEQPASTNFIEEIKAKYKINAQVEDFGQHSTFNYLNTNNNGDMSKKINNTNNNGDVSKKINVEIGKNKRKTDTNCGQKSMKGSDGGKLKTKILTNNTVEKETLQEKTNAGPKLVQSR